MPSSFQARILPVALLLATCALAQGTLPALHGTWTATSGAQTLRGSWGAETSPGAPNSAQGYWTLLNESGERVLEGTWSALKTGSRWHGTWTARTAQRQSFSGSWDADLPESKHKTFVDMLSRTLEKEVAGSWQSGRLSGNWWLRGQPPKKGPR